VSLRIALYTREMKRILVFALSATLIYAPSANAASSITVFAASSLSSSLPEIAKRFKVENKNVKIKFSFQSSTTLIGQIAAGAPADIFLSAEPFLGGTDYLVNSVVLAVPKSSNIKRLKDLNHGVTWIQCAYEIPCGQAAKRALMGTQVTSKPLSLEPKSSSVIAKLKSGEVDAAIVYNSDLIANKGFRGINFPNSKAAETIYQIRLISKDKFAMKFFNYLNSESVKRTLVNKGFSLL
jgi:molybdate transport system substrate-binding protein